MNTGTLRIHLGAAPGVGKTVAMLAEGRRRAERGADVVVGFCETHGRAGTEAALEGMEIVPRLTRRYRGSDLAEMDLEAVLRRAPQVALVDELAHTNVPGGRHEKRWQDVETLLAAGIDVISTVNIQHLESLNDATYAITGVLQRETVPDTVVRRAEQIELVDVAPEALRRRMAHGNIYGPEKIDASLANYFRQGNLTALRELALLWLADRVDESLCAYRADHGIAGTWPTRPRIVVALSGGREGATLLRRAARMAGRDGRSEMHAVLVAHDDGLRTVQAEVVTGLRRLTEELGGVFHTVSGPDAADAVVQFARGINADQIIVGLSRRSRWRAALRPGTGDRIITASGEDIDVRVVTHELAHTGDDGRPVSLGLPTRRVQLGFLAAVFAPGLLTAVLAPLSAGLGLPLTVQLYLLLTVLVALLGGMMPAVTAGVLSSLLINWFFTRPIGTLTIADPRNAAALVLFVLVGAAVSFVVHTSARRAADAVASQQEATALVELSHTMLSSTDELALLLTRAVKMFDQDAAAIVRVPRGGSRTVIASTRGYHDVAARRAPQETTCERIDDEHELVLVGRPVAAGRQRLLSAYARHAAAVVHRRALLDLANSADALARDNKARTALLSAVSHDLRTPLAGIKAAVGSLRSDVTFPPEDQAELLEAVEDSTDRLNLLIDNLLDMSRLQSGALVANPRPIDLAEVIGPVVRALANPENVTWSLDGDARFVVADPGLLDRVFANILENAERHAGNLPITVTASALGERAQVRIADRGPGIPVEARDDIFRPFQRYGDAPAGDGVGLGLAVARGLIESMGGTLVADDTPGGGTTMVVELPVAAPQRDEERAGARMPGDGPRPEAARGEGRDAQLARRGVTAS